MRFLVRSLSGLLLLALTLVILGAAVLVVGDALRARLGENGGGRPAVERIVAAPVATVRPGRVVPVLTAYGRIEARRVLDLRSRQAGTVVWVADGFRNGLAVVEGEVLARLDPAPAEEALALARADLAEATAEAAEATAAVALTQDDLAAAEAQLALRRQALERQREIASRGAGSSQAVETAELAVSAAEQAILSRRQALAAARAAVDRTAVAVTRAGIALGEAERNLRETEIRAGLSGRVDGVTLAPGAVIGANEALGRIIDPSALDVAVQLSTAQLARLIGADGGLVPARITVLGGAGTAEAKGRLDRLGVALAEGQTGRLVYGALDQGAASGLWQPGDFVELRIEEPPLDDAATLPALALGRDGTVLALGPEDRLEALPVEVLRRQGDAVIIRVGQLAGREVVQERSALLGEGIRIRPIRAGAMVPLSPERRAALTALVNADATLTGTERARLLRELQADTVPAALVDRLQTPAGG
jgi:multidrug efflux pump subunit AcrA (membrane-fusion protein)